LGEYVEFTIGEDPKSKHPFYAKSVTGILGNRLMCESRRLLKGSKEPLKGSKEPEKQHGLNPNAKEFYPSLKEGH